MGTKTCLLAALAALACSAPKPAPIESIPTSNGETNAAAGDIIDRFGREQTIRGRVVDAGGRPIEGATLYAGVYTISESTPSDAEGRFVVGIGAGYGPGQGIHLSVRALGFVVRREQIPLGEQDRTIVLDRGATLTGTFVVDGSDTLPESVDVTLRSNRGAHVATARGGTFEMSGFDPGPDTFVEVRIDGWTPFWFSGLVLTEGETYRLGALGLERGASFEVSVCDAFGEFVEGAGVQVTTTTTPELSWFARAGADGVARVLGLPIGRELRVDTGPPEGFGRSLQIEHSVSTVTIESRVERLDVVLQRPVVLRGELVWTGDGEAPWDGDRQIGVRVFGTAEGLAAWHYDGAVPYVDTPIGEREAARFAVHAPPGTWALTLATQRDGESRSAPVSIGTFEIPVPARGERSGEYQLGKIELGPSDLVLRR